MIRRLAFFVISVAAILGLLATTASASPITGAKHFTGSDRSFQMTDRNGTFTAQTYYRNEPPPEIGQFAGISWSFKAAPQVAAIATTPMDCTAGLNPDARQHYHDHHAGIPADYLWHSSTPTVEFDRSYQLYGNCVFRVNVGGNTGTANLGIKFTFDIADGLPTARTAQQPYASTLNVSYDRT